MKAVTYIPSLLVHIIPIFLQENQNWTYIFDWQIVRLPGFLEIQINIMLVYVSVCIIQNAHLFTS